MPDNKKKSEAKQNTSKNNNNEDVLTESDIAQDKMGNNQLQGNDQAQVRNQRQAVPGEKQETDGVIESFEKLDKEVRAERDLGKGNRSSDAS